MVRPPSVQKPSAAYVKMMRDHAPITLVMAREQLPTPPCTAVICDCCVPCCLSVPCCCSPCGLCVPCCLRPCQCYGLGALVEPCLRLYEWNAAKLTAFRWQYVQQQPVTCADGPCTNAINCWVTVLGNLPLAAHSRPVPDKRNPYLNGEKWSGGQPFFVGGRLCIPDLDEVNARVTGPMERGLFIGVPAVPPDSVTPDFPLALANGDCRANDGRHATFRRAFDKYFKSEATFARASYSDPVMSRLLGEVAAAYNAEGGEFTPVLAKAVQRYTVCACFWILFGLDAAASPDTLALALWASSTAAVAQFIDLQLGGLQPALPAEKNAQLHKLYLDSPALADYEPEKGATGALSKADFVRQFAAGVQIAALQGTPQLAGSLMSGSGATPIDSAWMSGRPRGYKLPLGDFAAMRLVVLETARLNPPVPETTYTLSAPETFQTPAGVRTLPKGCPVMLGYANTCASPKLWGANPFKFDPGANAAGLWGEAAQLHVFNSMGDRGDRRCPGREVVIKICVAMLEACEGGGTLPGDDD